MTQQSTGRQPVFYSICLSPYDGAEQFQGPLAQMRRRFFETGHSAHTAGEEAMGGRLSRYKGKIHGKRLKWCKKVDKITMEETLPVAGGSALLLRNSEGRLVSRVLYRENLWEKSTYFRPGDDRPMVILEPVLNQNQILRLDLLPETGQYRRQYLLPCPYAPGTAHQSAVNAQAGEPTLIASTSLGDFCYCSQEEQALRLRLEQEAGRLEDLSPFISEEPAAPMQPEEEPAITEKEEPTPTEEPAPPAPVEEETAPPTAQEEPIPPDSYAADHEVYHVDVEPQPAPTRYRVAVKRARGPVLADHERLSRSAQPPQEENAPPLEGKPAAKRIIISAEESCLYFGELLDGMRTGHGRTELENGTTAYEGDYENDLRDGWGVCYYRSGEPCYIGGWKENHRDGLGATFQEGEHALHVGLWKNGVPGKMGSLFDKDGNLRFAGRMENGMRQGAGVSYRAEDGSLFVGKWKDNKPTGEGTEFDSQGNLVYTGMWKDGKRHGRGTEFDAQGNVLFTGEWREDRYYEGVRYSRLIPPGTIG